MLWEGPGTEEPIGKNNTRLHNNLPAPLQTKADPRHWAGGCDIRTFIPVAAHGNSKADTRGRAQQG